MNDPRMASSDSFRYLDKHKTTVLVLQGGGALGAYQAGAYEGLVEAGLAPSWIAGVSIGAINAALIAGNPPHLRVERLRLFWDQVSSVSSLIPPLMLDPFRPMLNSFSATTAVTFGVPGFFTPRLPPPYFVFDGSEAALSLYDTTPLVGTLEELIDFGLINKGDVRLSLGAVNIKTGNSVYFDSKQTEIKPDHVRASASLPPGFPPIEIDGEQYWDGGIVSNTPLWYVLDDSPRMDALVVQVDLFSARGELPRKFDQVLEREKDIQYSSKTRFNTNRIKELAEIRAALGRLLAKLPPEFSDDPDLKTVSQFCVSGNITIAHLINRHLSHTSQSKDYEFSRTTINELWAAGREDVRHAAHNTNWIEPEETWAGIRTYDLTR